MPSKEPSNTPSPGEDDARRAEPPAGPSRAPGDGRRTRWDAHRVERREQLVEAALEVLAEVGPEFGLDQVAERAGVTKPVIYRHFADRAGLVDAMGERATATLLDERIMPALQADLPPLARIRASVSAFLSFLEDHPNIYWIFVRHAPADGSDVARADKELIAAALGSLLGDFLRAWGGDVGTAEVWAHGLVGFVQNTAEWWLERRTMSRDALVEYVTTLVWAQLEGVARRHGLVLRPEEVIRLEDAPRRADDGGSGSSRGAAG